MLALMGISPRTAQQAMRHSQIGLTMNIYTDTRLLDVSGAIESLPSLPLSDSTMPTELESQRATGTDDRQSSVTPTTPAGAYSVQIQSSSGKLAGRAVRWRNEKTPIKHAFHRGFV
jgi:hypothetical protein